MGQITTPRHSSLSNGMGESEPGIREKPPRTGQLGPRRVSVSEDSLSDGKREVKSRRSSVDSLTDDKTGPAPGGSPPVGRRKAAVAGPARQAAPPIAGLPVEMLVAIASNADDLPSARANLLALLQAQGEAEASAAAQANDPAVLEALLRENPRLVWSQPAARQTLDGLRAALRKHPQDADRVLHTQLSEADYHALINDGLIQPRHIPAARLTAAQCQAAVARDPMLLAQVPQAMRTPQLCLQAVQANGEALQHVPPAHRSRELCLAAVKNSPFALAFVPQELLTDPEDREVVFTALAGNGMALQFVPAAARDESSCRRAVMNNGSALQWVPVRLRTGALCDQAIECDGRALAFVPPALITRERCEMAVALVPQALAGVPPKYLTPAMCRSAFHRDASMLRLIPHEIQTPAMCARAVEADGLSLNAVAPRLLTPEICQLAVRNNPRAIASVPRAQLTPAMCADAVKKDPSLLRLVPDDLRTPAMWEQAGRRNPRLLLGLPPQQRTKAMWETLLAHDWTQVTNIPEGFAHGDALRLREVRRHPEVILEIPWECQTHELWRAAVSRNPALLLKAPYDMRNEALYLTALEKDIGLFEKALADWGKPLTARWCKLAIEKNPALASRILDLARQADPRGDDEDDVGPWSKRVLDSKSWPVIAAANLDRLGDIPKKYRTLELCRQAVLQHPDMIRHVPRAHVDEAWITFADAHPRLFADIPHYLMTPERCQRAVQIDPKLINAVPKEERTQAVYAALLAHGMEALRHIKPDDVDDALCAAVKAKLGSSKDNKAAEPGQLIIPGLIGLKIYPRLVRQSDLALEQVPPAMRTTDVYAAHVVVTRADTKSVPAQHKTPEFWKQVLAAFPEKLADIPRKDRSLDLCRVAYKAGGGDVSQWIPIQHHAKLYFSRTQ